MGKPLLKPGDRRLLALASPVALILILAVLTVRNHGDMRRRAQRAYCINNLKIIAHAKEQWATNSHAQPTDVPAWSNLIGTTTWLRTQLVCKVGGTYSLNPLNQKPTCSIPSHTF